MRRTELFSQLFARKSIDKLIRDADEPEHALKKTLGPWSLTALGIGAVIGSGIFTVIGTAISGEKFDAPSIPNTPLAHYIITHTALAGRPGAGPAIVAPRAVHNDRLRPAPINGGLFDAALRNSAPRTGGQAEAALLYSDTPHLHPAKLRLKPLRFRAVAPGTAQVTPFEKHRRSYAGAIVDGEPLNVEYLPCRGLSCHSILFPFGCGHLFGRRLREQPT